MNKLKRKPDDEIGYFAAHCRTTRARGRAGDRACVDCGGTAREWSLKHDANVRMHGVARGNIVCAYSPDPYDYEPRCKGCHTTYDRRLKD